MFGRFLWQVVSQARNFLSVELLPLKSPPSLHLLDPSMTKQETLNYQKHSLLHRIMPIRWKNFTQKPGRLATAT